MTVDFNAALNFIVDQCSIEPGLNLAVSGDLGAGKTYFIQNLVFKLDPSLVNQVTSPSFNICNNYVGSHVKIDHFDLYRLEESEQLDEIGLFESLDDVTRISVVEWANSFPEIKKWFKFDVNISLIGTDRIYSVMKGLENQVE